MSFAVGGRPGLRFLLPSYLAAMRWRYQRRSVAGVATDAIWASASRPKAWALTASLRRSSSERLRRLPRSPARSTRFSSRKWSITSCCWRLTQPARTSSRNCTWYVIMDLKITPSGQTIVKPTALGPAANTDTKLLIYGLFQKGRVLAQDAVFEC